AVREPAIPAAVPLNTPLNVCGAAVAETVSMTSRDPPAGMVNVGGENATSLLVGAVTSTDPVNPFAPAAETVTFVLCPGWRLRLAGRTLRAKWGAPETVIVAVTFFVAPAAGVKVNVALYVPAGSVLAAPTVNAAGAGPLDGVNVMPDGALGVTVTG